MGKQWKQWQTLFIYFFGPTITADGDCNHEIKRCLPLGRKVMTNLDSVFGEGKGTPLQYSCLENPMDGGAWWASVYGVAQSRTRRKRLSSRLVIAFLPRSKPHFLNFMVAVTICSDFGAQENKVSLFPLFPHLFAMK